MFLFDGQIKLVAPPLYTVSVSTLQPKLGIKKIDEVVRTIKEALSKCGGNLVVKEAARVISNEASKFEADTVGVGEAQ